MDKLLKRNDENIVPFTMQSNILAPTSMLSPVQTDDKQRNSIITLENADLDVQSNTNIHRKEEMDEKMSTI